MPQNIRYFFTVFSRSYSQLFFEENVVYGILIFVVTLTSPFLALNTAVAITASIFVAPIFKFNSKLMMSGKYGINPFLSGGTIFLFYHHSFLLAALGGIISMFFTQVFIKIFRSQKLPFLSFPFITTSFLILLLFKPEPSATPVLETNFNSNFIYSFFTIITHCFSSMCFLTYWWQGLILAILLLVFNINSFVNVILALTSVALVLIFINWGSELISFYYYGFNFVLIALAVQHLISANFFNTLILIPILTIIALLLLLVLHPIFNQISLSAFSIPFTIVVLLTKIIQNRNSIPKNLWKKK